MLIKIPSNIISKLLYIFTMNYVMYIVKIIYSSVKADQHILCCLLSVIILYVYAVSWLSTQNLFFGNRSRFCALKTKLFISYIQGVGKNSPKDLNRITNSKKENWLKHRNWIDFSKKYIYDKPFIVYNDIIPF